jgi:photosynthesis system II assembly factor YCF48-like protein
MAPDERERNFDKALGRHLRSAAAADKAASSPAGASSPRGSCPDTETLAAYHERSLLPEQLNSLKEHFVGCANCQTVLAHLETTDEIQLQAAEEDQVLAQTASTPVISTPQQIQAPAGALARKSRRARLLKGAGWQWLAPAGAIAAGLLIWVALHEHRPLPRPNLPQRENEVAQNREPAAPLPSVSTGVPQSSARSKSADSLSRPQPPAPEPRSPIGRFASGAAKQSHAPSDATGTGFGNAQSEKELRAGKDDKRKTATDQLAAADHADLDAKNLPLASRQEVQVESQEAPVQTQVVTVQPEIAPSQNAPAQYQNIYTPPKATGPTSPNHADAAKKVKREAAAAPAPPPPAAPPPKPAGDSGAASSYSTSESVVVTGMISSPRLISPPRSNLIWRVGRTGLIEISKDGGSSWSRQNSGVLADLLTGVAPSDQVCWIVGRAGAILLTTDGGAHWKIVPSPLSEDLGGVRATDAFHATIWNARGTKSFETSDGGLTWKPVPHP